MKLGRLIIGIVALGVVAGCDAWRHNAAKHEGDSFAVGFECGYEPYGFFDSASGRYRGYDLDLAREVAKRNHWRLELKPVDWRIKDSLINSGEIDCIWNGFKIEGREDEYEWGAPYLMDACIVVSRTNLVIRSIADLRGKTFAVQTTTPNYGFLQPGGKWAAIGKKAARVIPVDDFVLLVQELRENPECQAIITDFLAIQYWQRSRHMEGSNLGVVLSKTHNGIAFRRGNVALRNQVQKTLDEMVKDGTFNRITQEWFGLIPDLLKNAQEGAILQ